MARFRRALVGLFAAIALVCGYGWTVAALACPSTTFAASEPDAKDDGCGQPATHDCAIPYCGPVCIGVTPIVAAVKPVPAIPANFHQNRIMPPPDNNFGPEPPPPRLA